MEAQDYVSKIARIEKMSSRNGYQNKGIIIPLYASCEGVRCSPVRHFLPHPNGLYRTRTVVPVRFGALELNRRRGPKTTLDRLGNSARQRAFSPSSPFRFRKKRSADQYCRLDCQNLYAVCHSRRYRLPASGESERATTRRHFSINTDINTLISPDLDWRKRDNQFEQAFDREKLILAVVEAPTPGTLQRRQPRR